MNVPFTNPPLAPSPSSFLATLDKQTLATKEEKGFSLG
jgi:hypothetical protein